MWPGQGRARLPLWAAFKQLLRELSGCDDNERGGAALPGLAPGGISPTGHPPLCNHPLSLRSQMAGAPAASLGIPAHKLGIEVLRRREQRQGV